VAGGRSGGGLKGRKRLENHQVGGREKAKGSQYDLATKKMHLARCRGGERERDSTGKRNRRAKFPSKCSPTKPPTIMVCGNKSPASEGWKILGPNIKKRIMGSNGDARLRKGKWPTAPRKVQK